MSNAPATRSRARRLVLAIAALGLITGLSGCVIAPAGGYYHDYGYGYHHHYWR